MERIIQAREAGVELATMVNHAYHMNCDIPFTVKIECHNEAGIVPAIDEVLMTAKLEEVQELIPKKALFFARPSLGSLFHTEQKSRAETYSMTHEWKDRVLTMTFIIHGASPDFRWQYEYNYYTKKNLYEIFTRTKGLNEMDKAWEIATWLAEKVKADYNLLSEEVDVTPKAVSEGTAQADDEALADVYLFYAVLAGVDTEGCIYPENPEEWEDRTSFFMNVIEAGGKEYYLDMTEVKECNKAFEQTGSTIGRARYGLATAEQVKGFDLLTLRTPFWGTVVPFTNVPLN